MKESKDLKKELRERSGITLIALIITIIVLLILAGISIMMLSGDNNILNRAAESKDLTDEAKIVEGIKLGILSTITNGDIEYSEEQLKEEITKQDVGEDIQVIKSSEEYKYIVNVDNEAYGVKNDNNVVKLRGIYDRYIYVSKVEEYTPKYQFINTATQKSIDEEVGGKNTSYIVEGVSLQEDGEYITEGTIEGKSGTLEIKDLQLGTYEYTLTKFFMNDEVFYAKIKIGDNIEKIQRLIIVQGDVVQYEANFAGIEYEIKQEDGTYIEASGHYEDIDNDLCYGGKARWLEPGLFTHITFYGKKLDYSKLCDEKCGYVKDEYFIGTRENVDNLDNRVKIKVRGYYCGPNIPRIYWRIYYSGKT